ncbi:unnamed protein product [Amoebophrya sp. A25]|nr:unnamed protein product [Amoebophrya sp. A25]|eukprot:GSA25T00009609001.1
MTPENEGVTLVATSDTSGAPTRAGNMLKESGNGLDTSTSVVVPSTTAEHHQNGGGLGTSNAGAVVKNGSSPTDVTTGGGDTTSSAAATATAVTGGPPGGGAMATTSSTTTTTRGGAPLETTAGKISPAASAVGSSAVVGSPGRNGVRTISPVNSSISPLVSKPLPGDEDSYTNYRNSIINGMNSVYSSYNSKTSAGLHGATFNRHVGPIGAYVPPGVSGRMSNHSGSPLVSAEARILGQKGGSGTMAALAASNNANNGLPGSATAYYNSFNSKAARGALTAYNQLHGTNAGGNNASSPGGTSVLTEQALNSVRYFNKSTPQQLPPGSGGTTIALATNHVGGGAAGAGGNTTTSTSAAAPLGAAMGVLGQRVQSSNGGSPPGTSSTTSAGAGLGVPPPPPPPPANKFQMETAVNMANAAVFGSTNASFGSLSAAERQFAQDVAQAMGSNGRNRSSNSSPRQGQHAGGGTSETVVLGKNYIAPGVPVPPPPMLDGAAASTTLLSRGGGANNNNTSSKGTTTTGGPGGQQHSAKNVIEIEERFVGLIFGRGASTIRALKEDTGASIFVEKDSDPKRVVIRGSKMAVETATRKIKALIENKQRNRVAEQKVTTARLRLALVQLFKRKGKSHALQQQEGVDVVVEGTSTSAEKSATETKNKDDQSSSTDAFGGVWASEIADDPEFVTIWEACGRPPLMKTVLNSDPFEVYGDRATGAVGVRLSGPYYTSVEDEQLVKRYGCSSMVIPAVDATPGENEEKPGEDVRANKNSEDVIVRAASTASASGRARLSSKGAGPPSEPPPPQGNSAGTSTSKQAQHAEGEASSPRASTSRSPPQNSPSKSNPPPPVPPPPPGAAAGTVTSDPPSLANGSPVVSSALPCSSSTSTSIVNPLTGGPMPNRSMSSTPDTGVRRGTTADELLGVIDNFQLEASPEQLNRAKSNSTVVSNLGVLQTEKTVSSVAMNGGNDNNIVSMASGEVHLQGSNSNSNLVGAAGGDTTVSSFQHNNLLAGDVDTIDIVVPPAAAAGRKNSGSGVSQQRRGPQAEGERIFLHDLSDKDVNLKMGGTSATKLKEQHQEQQLQPEQTTDQILLALGVDGPRLQEGVLGEDSMARKEQELLKTLAIDVDLPDPVGPPTSQVNVAASQELMSILNVGAEEPTKAREISPAPAVRGLPSPGTQFAEWEAVQHAAFGGPDSVLGEDGIMSPTLLAVNSPSKRTGLPARAPPPPPPPFHPKMDGNVITAQDLLLGLGGRVVSKNSTADDVEGQGGWSTLGSKNSIWLTASKTSKVSDHLPSLPVRAPPPKPPTPVTIDFLAAGVTPGLDPESAPTVEQFDTWLGSMGFQASTFSTLSTKQQMYLQRLFWFQQQQARNMMIQQRHMVQAVWSKMWSSKNSTSAGENKGVADGQNNASKASVSSTGSGGASFDAIMNQMAIHYYQQVQPNVEQSVLGTGAPVVAAPVVPPAPAAGAQTTTTTSDVTNANNNDTHTSSTTTSTGGMNINTTTTSTVPPVVVPSSTTTPEQLQLQQQLQQMDGKLMQLQQLMQQMDSAKAQLPAPADTDEVEAQLAQELGGGKPSARNYKGGLLLGASPGKTLKGGLGGPSEYNVVGGYGRGAAALDPSSYAASAHSAYLRSHNQDYNVYGIEQQVMGKAGPAGGSSKGPWSQNKNSAISTERLLYSKSGGNAMDPLHSKYFDDSSVFVGKGGKLRTINTGKNKMNEMPPGIPTGMIGMHHGLGVDFHDTEEDIEAGEAAGAEELQGELERYYANLLQTSNQPAGEATSSTLTAAAINKRDKDNNSNGSKKLAGSQNGAGSNRGGGGQNDSSAPASGIGSAAPSNSGSATEHMDGEPRHQSAGQQLQGSNKTSAGAPVRGASNPKNVASSSSANAPTTGAPISRTASGGSKKSRTRTASNGTGGLNLLTNISNNVGGNTIKMVPASTMGLANSRAGSGTHSAHGTNSSASSSVGGYNASSKEHIIQRSGTNGSSQNGSQSQRSGADAHQEGSSMVRESSNVNQNMPSGSAGAGDQLHQAKSTTTVISTSSATTSNSSVAAILAKNATSAHLQQQQNQQQQAWGPQVPGSGLYAALSKTTHGGAKNSSSSTTGGGTAGPGGDGSSSAGDGEAQSTAQQKMQKTTSAALFQPPRAVGVGAPGLTAPNGMLQHQHDTSMKGGKNGFHAKGGKNRGKDRAGGTVAASEKAEDVESWYNEQHFLQQQHEQHYLLTSTAGVAPTSTSSKGAKQGKHGGAPSKGASSSTGATTAAAVLNSTTAAPGASTDDAILWESWMQQRQLHEHHNAWNTKGNSSRRGHQQQEVHQRHQQQELQQPASPIPWATSAAWDLYTNTSPTPAVRSGGTQEELLSPWTHHDTQQHHSTAAALVYGEAGFPGVSGAAAVVSALGDAALLGLGELQGASEQETVLGDLAPPGETAADYFNQLARGAWAQPPASAQYLEDLMEAGVRGHLQGAALSLTEEPETQPAPEDIEPFVAHRVEMMGDFDPSSMPQGAGDFLACNSGDILLVDQEEAGWSMAQHLQGPQKNARGWIPTSFYRVL